MLIIMIKNKKFLYIEFLLVSFTIVFSIIGFLNSEISGILILSLGLISILSVFILMRKTYQDISQLSGSLTKILNGDYQLDISKEEEGDIAILRSEVHKMTVMLREQTEILKNEKTFLVDSLSDISHQLKTPITSMVLMTQLMSDESISQDEHFQILRKMKMLIEKMNSLVAILLKISKLDAGVIELKKDKVLVRSLIDGAVEPLIIAMELREIELKIEGKDDVQFEGDLYWTSEAIANIVKNCMEHTDQYGKVSVRFEENPIYTSILIEDTGSGINPEDLPNIFKRFYKGKSSSENSVGIGLSLAKTIIDKQNGSIKAYNTDVGAAFKIKFYKQQVLN